MNAEVIVLDALRIDAELVTVKSRSADGGAVAGVEDALDLGLRGVDGVGRGGLDRDRAEVP